ncbi:MAG: DUF362 domain-containing protein [Halanaerobiaceae bacterium]
MVDYNIGVIYGDQGREMALQVLEEYGLEEKLPEDRNALIVLKPNLVLDSPAEEGATTDPEIIEGILEYLFDRGWTNIKIMESSWVGCSTGKAFKVCGYEQLATRWDIELVDLKNDSTRKIEIEGETLKVCEQPLRANFIINLPVLKAHCQTKMTCALKNMKGCIPDSEKRRYHTEGLHRPIALLNKVINTDFVLVDGIYGDLTFEEGGNPVKMNRIIFGEDPVLVDLYAARLLGLQYEDIGYLNYFREDLLTGLTVNKINSPKDTIREKDVSRSAKVEKLAEYISSDAACSSCYGNLIQALYRLQEEGINPQAEIYIGQGYHGRELNGLGIGRCLNGASTFIGGCPPETGNIVNFLRRKVN